MYTNTFRMSRWTKTCVRQSIWRCCVWCLCKWKDQNELFLRPKLVLPVWRWWLFPPEAANVSRVETNSSVGRLVTNLNQPNIKINPLLHICRSPGVVDARLSTSTEPGEAEPAEEGRLPQFRLNKWMRHQTFSPGRRWSQVHSEWHHFLP